jgi:hypothetical protein
MTSSSGIANSILRRKYIAPTFNRRDAAMQRKIYSDAMFDQRRRTSTSTATVAANVSSL